MGGDDGADDLPPSFQRHVTLGVFPTRLAAPHKCNRICRGLASPDRRIGRAPLRDPALAGPVVV